MEDQKDYFGTKPDQEILRNVASSVDEIINRFEERTDKKDEEEEDTPNPLVDAVGKAIKFTKPKGLFMQGVSLEETPKKS